MQETVDFNNMILKLFFQSCFQLSNIKTRLLQRYLPQASIGQPMMRSLPSDGPEQRSSCPVRLCRALGTRTGDPICTHGLGITECLKIATGPGIGYRKTCTGAGKDLGEELGRKMGGEN